jgi:hypothetical protein
VMNKCFVLHVEPILVLSLDNRYQSAFSRSAADGAGFGCEVSTCRSSLDFWSNPFPHIGHVN